MTGTRVSAVTAYTAHRECTAASALSRGHRVRELVCSYRPVRDHEGRIVSVPSLAFNTPQAAAQVIAPLMADQPVEMFAVACLSAKNRLLAWHIVSRGTRSSTLVSIPDVFVPACVTPGTVSLLVVHNHPSGDPTPSSADVKMTREIMDVAKPLGIQVHDHIIVGREGHASLKGLRLI